MKIKVYNNIQDLSGTGEEWLVNYRNDVIAVFIDGQLRCQVLYLNDKERTKVA